MSIIINENDFRETLEKIDKRIRMLNDQKITALFESLGLNEREDIPQDYLTWENILVVVPSRIILNDLKKYKVLITGITLLLNPNAVQIHLFDSKEWDSMTRTKTQFQIRELLKTNFGGVPKISEKKDWTKLF
ncbi:hypothetical protein EV144_104120 [Flavobacterium sp. 270]|uniref:hypothetical protein n=1 Tax=Flavobacterium sp. 270 TaxID=2512114 RepID=UPI001066FE64|nr:hypothetical protein [Flavobacterium sp. 270]TDW47834.1 hypothetical protein EV144_104120 [Flavobacterium sp. 270]